jgi:hypothetical protein
VLPGPGQRFGDAGQGARLRHRAGDGPGLLALPGPGHRPRDLGQSAPRQTGELMEPAMATACSCWPALAIAPAIATGVRITAGQFL